MKEALSIHVTGIVQGVGFRPFVYRQAKRHLITGWVLNAADGVTIHAEGEPQLLDEFVIALSEEAPAAAQVSEIEMREVPLEDCDAFEIRFSDDAEVDRTTLVSPDLATCPDCLRELFDPTDRRYRYPFINCTNCGPRFTITAKLPYDRANTSMASFHMCPDCAREYADPANRRFHAQPDACFACGPKVWLRCSDEQRSQSTVWGTTREESDAIFARAVALLREGGVLAVKGLGGYHLACDADNAQAVATLRERKRRFGKPFAVMLRDTEAVREACEVSAEEAALLEGAQRPIVLLRKRADAAFAPGLADNLPELGVMLPYTPVQHLLLHDFVEAGGRMLVMTSGNLHDEPIVIDDEEALSKLLGIADAVLGNDRPILARYDDSVVRVLDAGEAGTAIQVVRRARGLSPVPLALNGARSVLAVGPEQKNTLCLTRDDGAGGAEAFVSQHIGDMENAETFDAWLDALARYRELFEIEPTVLACDMHPEYLPSKWARERERADGLPLVEVQHHHAHVVSAMAEHGIEGPACGFAFDGTGYGVDGAIWGGEVMLANLSDFERFANFAYVPMPGGAAAVKHPLRMAYGVLWAFDLLDHPGARDALEALGETADVCERMVEAGINTPHTSSVGRLFDAASALLGVCTEPLYEGEAAILLEACMGNEKKGQVPSPIPEGEASTDDRAYEIAITKNVATPESTARDTSVLLLDAAPVFEALLDDRAAGVPAPVIARRFHDAFVRAILDVAELVRGIYGISTTVLSGGVFMNRYLAEHALDGLARRGFTVAVNRDLPPNDGCVSFGQAVVASRR